MSDYLVWQAAWRDGVCRLGVLQNVDRYAELRFNHSRADGWPDAASFAMDPDFADDTEVQDRLVNLSDLVVVSARAVELLRGAEVGPVEFLPVHVLDHRGHAVAGGWHIVNPLKPVDCLDLAACQPTENKLLDGKIRSVKKLVLDPKRIDTRRRLFCCDRYHKPRLVHRSLAAAMDAAKLTGNRFVELQDYRA